MINATQVRPGHVIKMDGTLYRVLKVNHITPGKGNAQIQADIRNLKTGIKNNIRLRPGESVEKIDTEERNITFLYQEGDIYHFMDPKTYEQMELHASLLEDSLRYLKAEAQLLLMSCEDKPVSVTFPLKMSFTVTECDPPTKGMAGAFKDAKVENDSVFKVPLFIKPGDVIVVNTETGDYVEKG